MKRKEKIMVDSVKIKAEFEKRGRNPRKAAVEMGFNPQYFNNIEARGYISPSGLMLLEKMYNIRLDDIKPDEPEPEYPAHVIVFDKASVYYENDPDYNSAFVAKVAMLTEDHLKHDGFVLLNDVYKSLGVEYPKNLSYNMGWDDPEKSLRFDLLIKKDAIVINCNANGALHTLENRSEESANVTMADIYAQLTEIKLALNKIGVLQAELLKAWAPKG